MDCLGIFTSLCSEVSPLEGVWNALIEQLIVERLKVFLNFCLHKSTSCFRVSVQSLSSILATKAPWREGTKTGFLPRFLGFGLTRFDIQYTHEHVLSGMFSVHAIWLNDNLLFRRAITQDHMKLVM